MKTKLTNMVRKKWKKEKKERKNRNANLNRDKEDSLVAQLIKNLPAMWETCV